MDSFNVLDLGGVVVGEPGKLGVVVGGPEDAVEFFWETKVAGAVEGGEREAFPLVGMTLFSRVVICRGEIVVGD